MAQNAWAAVSESWRGNSHITERAASPQTSGITSNAARRAARGSTAATWAKCSTTNGRAVERLRTQQQIIPCPSNVASMLQGAAAWRWQSLKMLGFLLQHTQHENGPA